MKILLINPNSESEYRYAGVETQPLGLAYIAAVLENDGYDVDIIDGLTLGLRAEDVKELVGGKQPDLVGITAFTPTIRAAYHTLKLVREVSDAFICIGGPHVSFLIEQSLKECKSLDAVVVGEGEYTMLDLVKNFENGNENLENVRGIFFKKGTRIIRNPPRESIENLDVLLFPARHLLPAERYGFLTIVSSRGCPFSCIYCASSAFMGRRFRMRGAGIKRYTLTEQGKSFLEEHIKTQEEVRERFRDFGPGLCFMGPPWFEFYPERGIGTAKSHKGSRARCMLECI